MGWQDAPLVGGDDQQGWRGAPLVSQPAQGAQPAGATSSPVSPSSASPPDLGSTAIWNKPADASWRDFFLAHMAKPFQGANQAAQDYARVAGDAFTFGGQDWLQSRLAGTDLASERAATQAASARLGAMAPIVQGATYAMGPGELGAASKIGGLVAPALGRWGGGVVGSAAEGAATGALGAYGHGENALTGAALGGALGGAGGMMGGVVGRGGELPPAKSAQQLQGEAGAAWAPISSMGVDANDLTARISSAEAAIRSTPEWANLLDKPAGKNTLDELAKLKIKAGNAASGTPNLTPAQQQVLGSIQGMNPAAQAQVINQMPHLFPNGMPTGSTTLPATVVNSTQDTLGGLGRIGNFASSELDRAMPPGAPTAIAQAKQASSQAADMARLNDMVDIAGRPKGPDVGTQMARWLQSPEGQTFSPTGSPQYLANQQIGNTAAGPVIPGGGQGLTLWDLKHHLMWPLVGLGVSQAAAGFGAGEGKQSPWMMLPEDLLGLAAGYALKKGLSGANMAAQMRAIDAARSAYSTGQFQPSVLPTAPIRDALRNLIFGRAAAGNIYPRSP